MTKLTKEFMQDIISGNGFGVAPSAVAAMARQLLASMEQEPVACIDRGNLDYLDSGADADVWPASEADSDDVLLYAAPQLPQPAVVDEWWMMCGEWRDETVSIHDASGLIVSGISPNAAGIIIEAHNTCRAAMLQGAEPVSQPCTLRDGWVAVPVEPTEDMVIAGFEAELREEFRDPEAWEAFEAMSGCEQAATRAKWCWAAMISAAPQQEASNRIQEERVKIQEEMAMGARLTKHRFKVK